MLSLADVNKLVLQNFSEEWTFCPIIWDLHNTHADVDKVLKSSEVKLVATPYVEFVSVEPLEIPVTLSMRRAMLTLNVLTAEPEGIGNKASLDAMDAMTSIYTQKTLRLQKPETSDFVTLDFGEVEMGSSELMAGKFVTLLSTTCVTYF